MTGADFLAFLIAFVHDYGIGALVALLGMAAATFLTVALGVARLVFP